MKTLRNFLPIPCLLILIVSFSSFVSKTKPHLIVGSWKISEPQKISLLIGEDLDMVRFTFSSDEFTAKLSLKNEKGEELESALAYKIYENHKGFKKPLIVLKNSCDKEVMLVFSIIKLTKNALVLKLQTGLSKGIQQTTNTNFTFKRIAGPAENME